MRPMHRLICAGAAALLALVLALPAAAGEVTVTVGHSRIEPAQVTVKTGDTVVFHNVDEMPGGHTVVAADGSFESPPLAKDEKWSHTFEKAGTTAITIRQHPNAKGEIVVE
jgi:plastocyanin